MSRRWILLIPLLMAILNLVYLCLQVSNPRDTSTPESLLVYCAQRVQHGQSLYQDYHRPPFNYMPYTPLYTSITGMSARWLSLTVGGVFFLGRVFTLMCCVAVVLLIYRKDKDGTSLTDASGSFLFLASMILWQWAATNRPDMLALALSLGGFLLYTRFANSPLRWFSLLLFVLAFLSKQSSVSAPAAIALSQVLNKRYREAVLVVLGFVVPAAAFMIAMHAATGGLSTLNIIENNAAPAQWLNIKLVGVLFLEAAALPLILAFMGAAEQGRRYPQTVYLLTSLAIAIVASAKLGSNINYYLEPLAAACLLVPAGIRSLEATPNGSAALIPLVLILSIPAFSFIFYSLQNPGFRSEPSIRKVAAEAEGPILTDSPRLALISRQQFWIDPFPFSYLEKQGRWDSRELVSMLDRHQVPFVILTLPIESSSSWQGAKRLPQTVIDAVHRSYVLQQRLDAYYIYIPR